MFFQHFYTLQGLNVRGPTQLEIWSNKHTDLYNKMIILKVEQYCLQDGGVHLFFKFQTVAHVRTMRTNLNTLHC